MTSGNWKPDDFFRHADHLALYVGASELFGLIKRTMSLPPQWAALVGRETGDYSVVRAGGHLGATNVASVMFARISPVEVVWEEEHLATRDHYHLRATVRARVRLIADRMELRSFFTRVVGSRRVAKIDSVARYFQPSVRRALARIAAAHDAATLVDAVASDADLEPLLDAVRAECFSAGMASVDRPTVRFESAEFRQDQAARRQAARTKRDHQSQRDLERAIERAQVDHLDHLSKLLLSVKTMADQSPDVELPELIRSFDEQQRGELYQALFAAERPASKTRWIVAAAGRELLFFDPDHVERSSRRLTIDGPAGPIRSIQSARKENGGNLLLGAATGVYRLPFDADAVDLTLTVPDAPSVRGGFNAVAMVGNRVVASHSELGLCSWNLEEPGKAQRLLESMTRDASAVRNVQLHNGLMYASIDNRIVQWPADDPAPVSPQVFAGSQPTITALCVGEDSVIAGNSEGNVLRWHNDSADDPEVLHRGAGRPVESVWMIGTHGVRRLVYSDTSSRVYARVVGDTFSSSYEAGGQTLRRVEVAPDIIVATNDLRDRLFCWTPGEPAKPHATIGVSALCGNSIQDVCLVPTG